ncbi:MAG: hypothetical protein WC544_00695 [Patescibacteria group bacterium]
METLPRQLPPGPIGDIRRRELTLSEIISGAWQIFSEHLQAIILIALVIFLPLNIISAYMPGNNVDANDITNGTMVMELVVSLALLLVAGVLAPAAIAYIVSMHLENKPVDFKTAFRFALTRWLPLIGTTLLLVAFLLGLTFLLVIPAVIFGFYWAFTTYIVVLKSKSGLDAIRYSQSIVRGRWWKVAGYLLVFGLITGMITWVISQPFVNIHNQAFNACLSTLSDIIFTFSIVATTIFFINLDAVRRDNPARI